MLLNIVIQYCAPARYSLESPFLSAFPNTLGLNNSLSFCALSGLQSF